MKRAATSVRHQRKDAARASLTGVAADWLQAAVPPAADEASEHDAVVHGLRTALKRARALVRLFGDALGKRTRRQENLRLRDAARALAGARDAAVARALLHKLRRQHRGKTGAAITRVLHGLTDRPHATPTKIKTRATVAHAHAMLHGTVRRLRRLRLAPGEAGEVIEAGLRTSHRLSRHGMKRARAADAAAEFHDWRKQTKHLFYQLQFPGLTGSANARWLVRQLDKLQERLGTEHDTQLVMALLRSEPVRFGGTRSVARVIAVLEQRAKKLRMRCLRLGERVFSDKSAAFAKRFGRRLCLLRGKPGSA